MNSPVLFIDYDGVLHRIGPGAEDFERLPLLESWLRANPSVEVVISSTWRLEIELERLRYDYAEDLRARVIGITPHLERWGAGHRGEEVLAWLDRNGTQRRPWMAIDDRPEWFHHSLHGRLLVCRPEVGLTDEHIERLDAWLKGVSRLNR